MTDLDAPPASVGTKVLGSHRFDGGTGWLAPGHNSVLTQDGPDGAPSTSWSTTSGSPTTPPSMWCSCGVCSSTAAGWPVVSPQPFAGRETEALPSPEHVAGTWQVLRFDPESTDLVAAVPPSWQARFPWFPTGHPPPARLRIAGAQDGSGQAVELDAVVFGSWDWSRGRPALSFSGIDQHGVAWSGTKGARLMNDVPLGWAGRVMEWLGFATRLVLVNVLFVAGTLAGLVLFGLFPAAVAATTVLARLRLAMPVIQRR